MKTHQKSYYCSEARRRNQLAAQGYHEVNTMYLELMHVANSLANHLFRSVASDDASVVNTETIDLVMREREAAKKLFRDLAGIRLAYTTYAKVNPQLDLDSPKNGWQLKAWAPSETTTAMTYVLQEYNKLGLKSDRTIRLEAKLKAYYEMWEWLLADADGRLAAVGLWELANA